MKLTVSQYVVFLAKPILLAMISGLIFTFLINPANAVFQVSEVAISIYIQVMFLGFIFFSAFLLVRVDEEWKKTHEAILKKDFNLFVNPPYTIGITNDKKNIYNMNHTSYKYSKYCIAC